jgi:microsomal dipeptidase-like Zn-dependent dipeptidase
VGCTEAHLESLVKLGALVELCAVGALMGDHAHLPWMRAWGNVDAAACARIVSRFGPEHFIVSTDLGQSGNPTPADGLLRFVAALRAEGLDESALRTLGADNPRRLLGLE